MSFLHGALVESLGSRSANDNRAGRSLAAQLRDRGFLEEGRFGLWADEFRNSFVPVRNAVPLKNRAGLFRPADPPS
jgi:hypothetical protein